MMTYRFSQSTQPRQRGVALPVMLIMMLVMLVTSIYLLKSTNSATLSAGNLAYDAALSRAADYGLHRGFQWIDQRARTNKGALASHSASDGYFATMAPNASTRDAAFWGTPLKFVTDTAGNRIEYVIHRMCKNEGPYDTAGNTCVQTAANTAELGTPVPIGESNKSDGAVYAASPQLHYVITARITGARGGTVVNQMVVMIGV